MIFGGSLVISWYKHHGPFSPVLLRRSLEVAQAIFKVRGSVSKNHRQEETEEGEEGPRLAPQACDA